MDFYDSILGWFIIIGSLFPYSLQYYKIYKTSSVEGISDLMLLSGCVSSFFSMLAIIFNNFYKIINSDKILDRYLLSVPILQLSTPFTLIEISYLLFFIFTKEQCKKTVYLLWHILGGIFLTVVFPILMINLYDVDYVYVGLNILSGIFSIIMWIPQIITTCKQRGPGSLSIISLICQATGCLLVILFQLLDNTSPTIVIPYVIGFSSEMILVLMCLYYKCQLSNKDDFIRLGDTI